MGDDYNIGGKLPPNPYNVNFDPSVGNWNGTPGEYYTGLHRPPGVPANGESKGKNIRVNTDALKLFTRNLRELRPLLETCRTKLGTVSLLPGHFEDAYALSTKVVDGGESIKGVTEKFLRTAIDCIVEYAAGLDHLANEYSKTEELNKLAGAKFGDFVKGAQDYLNTAGVPSSSPAPPTTAPPTTAPPKS
ncbi:hypothetical protein [Actinokineospora alba]|uniref:hypothetical protein n=1 Tax=Actinokineospora alba TaxID=504798 RepID=UPI000B811120|nr:hypothetical protein [Actinokineospora alba]